MIQSLRGEKMVDIREAVKTAMNNVMDGVYGQDIAYVIDYMMREYNSDNVRKIGYSDVIISALYQMSAQARPHVTKWDPEDISFWKQIVDVMKEEDTMLTK